jgi:TolA-binding protein
MFFRKTSLWLSIFILGILTTTSGQEDLRRVGIDIGGGGTFVYGDVSSDLSYNGQLGIKYNLSRNFGIKGNFTAGNLEGSGSGFSFENQFYQYSLRGVFNISQLANIHRTLPSVNLHGYVGVGQVINDATLTAPNPDNDASYTGTSTSVPAGVRLEYKLSKRLDLFGDFNYSYTNNDELDAYDPKTAANRSNDGYSTFTIGLSYNLGKKSNDVADWSRPSTDRSEIKELKEEQESKITKIEQKIDNLQSQIENINNDKANQEALTKLEDQINEKLERLRNQKQADQQSESDQKMDQEDKATADSKDQTGDAGGSRQMQQGSQNTSVSPTQLSNKRFVNVIGSFKTLENAKSFVNEVNQEGYNPGILYDYPNNYYYVHVTKSATLDKAQEAIQQTRKDFNIEEAWIYFRSADDLEKLR